MAWDSVVAAFQAAGHPVEAQAEDLAEGLGAVALVEAEDPAEGRILAIRPNFPVRQLAVISSTVESGTTSHSVASPSPHLPR